jgi:hypothetical protein
MRSLFILLCLFALALALAACGTPGSQAAAPDPRQQAAAEATAIVQQAQATAIMLQAQAQATALVEQAKGRVVASQTAEPTADAAAGLPDEAANASPPPAHIVTTSQSAMQAQLVNVGFAAEGRMIIVQFRASPEEADGWWQGSMYVVDEATQTTYDEIPVMPKIGPLIGRPQAAGQVGYVMFVNAAPGATSLHPGTLVSVVLGKHKWEHIIVQ